MRELHNQRQWFVANVATNPDIEKPKRIALLLFNTGSEMEYWRKYGAIALQNRPGSVRHAASRPEMEL